MKVVPAAEISAAQWDAACDGSRSAWLFHRHAWLQIEREFFGFRDHSFAVMDGGEIVAVQPLYTSELGIGWLEKLLHSGIHRHTGFAAVDAVGAAGVNEAWSLAMRTILGIAAAEDADRIQLNSQNLSPVNLTAERQEIPRWVEENFQLGMNFGPNGMLPVPGMATCCADQVVVLDADESELFAALAESCRRAIRKAERHEVSFAGPGSDDVATYWRLAQLAAARTGERLPRREYFEALNQLLQPSGRAAFLFATHHDKPVAAVLLAIDKGAVSYLGGVSDPEYLPLRVNDFVHWSAMVWAKRAGHRYYRLGPIFPTVPEDWPIARVSRFKSKFGARSFSTIQGSLFRRPEKYLHAGLAHLSELCRTPVAPQ